MGDVVNFPIAIDSDLGRELVVDCCRFQEGILTEKQVRKKYRFDEAAWEALGNDEWVRKVEEESIRRVRDGSAKRERSQQLVTKAPDILDTIMSDASASPRHRVDAIKTLDSFAGGPESGAPASDRFVISIVLNSDVLRFDKSRAVDPNDIDPYNDTPNVLAAIAVKKEDDGGGQESI